MNHRIEIGVETVYVDEQSDPDADRYVFAYTITISNAGSAPAKLLNRHWLITDANGKVQEVRGEGVVGEQPYLRPGEVFRYTSTLAVTQLTRVSQWIDPPIILVRVYHDAATAEAIAYQGHKAFLARYAIPNPTMYHQDEKRQINEFLGEWLSLCLQAGHSLKTPMFICAA